MTTEQRLDRLEAINRLFQEYNAASVQRDNESARLTEQLRREEYALAGHRIDFEQRYVALFSEFKREEGELIAKIDDLCNQLDRIGHETTAANAELLRQECELLAATDPA